VHASAHDVADDEVALGQLHPDLVAGTRRCDAEDFRPVFHPFTVQADASSQGIMHYDVLRDVAVKDAPVARVVVVDRLDGAPMRSLFSWVGIPALFPVVDRQHLAGHGRSSAALPRVSGRARGDQPWLGTRPSC
jgi:hypothetical protein